MGLKNLSPWLVMLGLMEQHGGNVQSQLRSHEREWCWSSLEGRKVAGTLGRWDVGSRLSMSRAMCCCRGPAKLAPAKSSSPQRDRTGLGDRRHLRRWHWTDRPQHGQTRERR